MHTFAAFIACIAFFTASRASAQVTSPQVQIHVASNPALCLGIGADAVQGSLVKLLPCTDPTYTTLNATTGGATKLLFAHAPPLSDGDPYQCIAARESSEVFLEDCEDDKFQLWNLVGGTAEIVSDAPTQGMFCLEAQENSGTALFEICDGEATQQWTTEITAQ